MASARINSTSVLLSDEASDLNIDGSVVGALVTDSTPFYLHTAYQEITAHQRYFQGKSKTGIYAWSPPTGSQVLTRRPVLTNVGGVVTGSAFYLDDGVGYQVIAFSSSATGTSYPGINYLGMVTAAIEYKSDDQWAETEYSMLDAGQSDTILQIVGHAPCFAENPNHLKVLRDFIGRATSMVRQHSRKIGMALTALFPAYAAPFSAVSNFLQS